jgi:hypothetical protein
VAGVQDKPSAAAIITLLFRAVFGALRLAVWLVANGGSQLLPWIPGTWAFGARQKEKIERAVEHRKGCIFAASYPVDADAKNALQDALAVRIRDYSRQGTFRTQSTTPLTRCFR